MKPNAQMQTRQTRLNRTIASLILTLAAAVLLIWSPGVGSFAQEPNRQLMQPGSASTSKRIALIIGNGSYTAAPLLKNPPNDARDMAAALRALGFDVTSGINANQRDMKRLIREFGQKLKTGGSGLFYYAGHGVQSKGRNYLIPVDAEIQSEADVEDSAVDASLVLNYMDDAQNGLNIVILDACRNNPFARSFRSASDGLAQVDAPTGTLIAYATAPGRVASDGAGQNGLYTSELLKQMQVPGLTATEMFMRVRAEVMKQTANKQVPWEASSLVGSFYFSGAPTDTAPAAASTSRIDPTAFELSYWDTIKSSTNADDFKAYLERYPNGQFVALAKNRIISLDGSTRAVESKPSSNDVSATELAFWDSIKNSTNPADYKDYLEKYPNGQFATLAKRRAAEGNTSRPNNQPAEKESSSPFDNGGEIILPVAHYHGGMFTTALYAGILTVSSSALRFEETEKGGKPSHNFQVSCTEVAAVSSMAGSFSVANFSITSKSGKTYELRAQTKDRKGDGDKEVPAVLQTITKACKLQ